MVTYELFGCETISIFYEVIIEKQEWIHSILKKTLYSIL